MGSEMCIRDSLKSLQVSSCVDTVLLSVVRCGLWRRRVRTITPSRIVVNSFLTKNRVHVFHMSLLLVTLDFRLSTLDFC